MKEKKVLLCGHNNKNQKCVCNKEKIKTKIYKSSVTQERKQLEKGLIFFIFAATFILMLNGKHKSSDKGKLILSPHLLLSIKFIFSFLFNKKIKMNES